MKLIIEKNNSGIFAYRESEERFVKNQNNSIHANCLPDYTLDQECDLEKMKMGYIVFNIQDNKPIYAVYGQTEDRNYLLGYAKGNEKDIAEFYKDKQGYGLYLEKVEHITIPSGYADKRLELEKKKAELESELKKLDKEIKLLK